MYGDAPSPRLFRRRSQPFAAQMMVMRAHHGDVISITGKVASNPARKEVAMENMTQFLKKLIDRE